VRCFLGLQYRKRVFDFVLCSVARPVLPNLDGRVENRIPEPHTATIFYLLPFVLQNEDLFDACSFFRSCCSDYCFMGGVVIIVPAIEKCVKCRKAKHAHKPESHLFELDKSLCWKGWHAFRRGPATTLHQLGTPDREIQAILRHSNVAITQASYIKSVAKSQVNALDLVAAEMGNDATCDDSATEVKLPVN
jgi:hypothetical protein